MGPFTPAAPGTYQVVASYSGDGNFAPSSTACGDPKEAVTVARAAAMIATAVSSTPISLGGSFHDTATLTPPAGAPAPTGQVSFAVYGPGDSTCAGTPVFTSTNPLGAPGTTAVSGTFTPTNAGTYRVVARYAGDADFTTVSTACGDPGETVVVTQASVSVATAVSPTPITLGGSFHDTATLGAAPTGAAAPTGTVTFNVFGPGDATCTGAPVSTSTNPVNAAGTSATSTNFTPTSTGTYRVIASYSGDANYGPAATACNDAGEAAVVNKAPLALSTQVAPASVALGGSFHDTATLGSVPAGAPAPTGTVTFNVYGPGDAACAGAPLFASTNAVNAAGTTAVSGTFTPTATGTYRVVATYSGDANYNGRASTCADPAEAVAVGTASVPIATAVSPTPITLGGS
ncbi:MAG: Ig-like domain repeat protein, partial [Actinobacteria bacterium]|nr:Ig-like domain repeat protein [Actinomycetota bacterium]